MGLQFKVFNFQLKLWSKFAEVLYIYTGDFNGDGKTDLLVGSDKSSNTPTWTKWISNGVSFETTPFTFLDVQPNFNTQGDGIWVMDLNGDGKTDVLHANGQNSGSVNITKSSVVFRTYFSNGSDFQYLQHYPSLSMDYNQVFGWYLLPGDYNGDGGAEFLQYRLLNDLLPTFKIPNKLLNRKTVDMVQIIASILEKELRLVLMVLPQ